MTNRSWNFITPLQLQHNYDFSQYDNLIRTWINYQTVTNNIELIALHRSWAIETGIIENIYRLNDEQTSVLIEQGFELPNIPLNGTKQDPINLLAILKDHMTTLEIIYSEVNKSHVITRSAIRQLHQIIVDHQPTYKAMDQFGQWFDAVLYGGTFKTLVNNPTRLDGIVYQYCPPEYVDLELDNLLTWYSEYCILSDIYHPLLVAAWLHHRFTQIHPFADGNGRVARALATWHMVQNNGMPILVTRNDKIDYIDALESADDNNLCPLINFIEKLQHRSILQTMSNLK